MTTTQIEPKQMTKEEYIKSWTNRRPIFLTPIDSDYGVTQNDVYNFFCGELQSYIRIPFNYKIIFDEQFDDRFFNIKEVTQIIGHDVDCRVWDKMVTEDYDDDIKQICENHSLEWFNKTFNRVYDDTPSYEDLTEIVQNKIDDFVDKILTKVVVRFLYEISVEDLLDEYDYQIEKLESDVN